MKLNEILGVTPRLCHELANKKRNVAREFGFTLAEMMVVMLIMSIIMAAMAPVMTTRMKNDNSSPWKWAENKVDAYFGNSDKQIAMIGQRSVGTNENNAKLIIKANDDRPNHILFKKGNNILGNLRLDTDNRILLGSLAKDTTLQRNSIIIGNNASATCPHTNKFRPVVIGLDASVVYNNTNSTFDGIASGIAIGRSASVTGHSGIALGGVANATGGIAIGSGAKGREGIAIGNNTVSNGGTVVGSRSTSNTYYNTVYGGNISLDSGTTVGGSVAIGSGFSSSGSNNIVITPDISTNSKTLRTKGHNNVVIGSYATTVTGTGDEATGTDGAVVIGPSSKAIGGASVAVGHSANAANRSVSLSGNAAGGESIAIGLGSYSEGGSIAIGTYNGIGYALSARAHGSHSIAIGHAARTADLTFKDEYRRVDQTIKTADYAIALGENAIASGNNSAAIGYNTHCSGENSVCIGKGAVNDKPNVIQLGTEATTVYIPGSLVIGKIVGVGTGWDNMQNSVFFNSERGWHHLTGNYEGRDSNFTNVMTTAPINSFVKNPALSDKRLKYVGSENLDGLAKIRQLKPFNYTFKKDETKTPRVGVMAQDLQKVFPNAVKKGADGFLTIRMEDMFYALINAVKELDAKVTALTNEVKELRKENKEIKQRLKALEAK